MQRTILATLFILFCTGTVFSNCPVPTRQLADYFAHRERGETSLKEYEYAKAIADDEAAL